MTSEQGQDKPNPGTGGTVSPRQSPEDPQVEADENVPPVEKAAVRANQGLMREHPEGSAPPLDRLTQDKDPDWSDVT